MKIKKVRIKDNLFNKMFVFIALSIIIPLALLGYLSYDRSKSQLETVTSQLLQDNIELNKKQVNRLLKDAEIESEKMVTSIQLQKLLQTNPPTSFEEEKVFINRISQLIAQLKGTYGVYVFPKQMKYYPNYLELINGNDFKPSTELMLKVFELKEKGIWYHYWDESSKKPVFAYIRAVRSSYYYEPLGVIVLKIPDSLVREELSFPSSFTNYNKMIVDQDNNIISDADSSLYHEKFVPEEDWNIAETQLNEQGWKLITSLPNKEVTGNIEQIKNFTLWIVVISIFIVSIYLVFIVRNFTLPIKSLVSHMEKVRIGVLKHFRMERSRKDEIGQLVGGFNQMITGMSELIEQTKKMESDKRNFELQTLNHQINPHFFYNTLDAIKWRAEKVDEKNIALMVTKLANLLRFSLNNNNEWTTIERELEHAKNYLDIEKLRSNRLFKVFVQVDPTILKFNVIKLILQPIVENCIKHGISNLPEGKGKILLTAKRIEQDIIFIIEDNGPGLASNKLDKEKNSSHVHHGIGLKNVHKRLQIHFGTEYGIKVDEDHHQGYRVIIRHPVREKQ
ncbi:cache domain-containing sensor histidine kinase [Priestia flexa]|uniref:Sensor histidine kinase n=1 Tax=Priestia flexa TaxID=86664 RepID=A0ABU4J8H0_9BACI|nr:sensor histidine kinase [Priestia flexa]MBN8434151.1 sensor histidine kinase [Priestia flexa]MCA0966684.1 sensor histidine kinase [Priestia flexa]MCA1201747.1 sensor histidine kinase [Priestia flexa]MDW8517259.1 sensor histidine kinase [Priestia flexa]